MARPSSNRGTHFVPLYDLAGRNVVRTAPPGTWKSDAITLPLVVQMLKVANEPQHEPGSNRFGSSSSSMTRACCNPDINNISYLWIRTPRPVRATNRTDPSRTRSDSGSEFPENFPNNKGLAQIHGHKHRRITVDVDESFCHSPSI